MDRQQIAQAKRAERSIRAFRPSRALAFFGEVKQEVRRITWTPPGELWSSAKMVLFSMVVAGFAVFGIDVLLRWIVTLLENATKAVAG